MRLEKGNGASGGMEACFTKKRFDFRTQGAKPFFFCERERKGTVWTKKESPMDGKEKKHEKAGVCPGFF